MHQCIDPAILYVGTPVVLVSSCNEDGSFNLAPISSVWFLGWTAVLGFDASSKTPVNIQRTGECVLNFPSSNLVGEVDRLALLTGTRRVPLHKRLLGYRFERDKFTAAGLRSASSERVKAPRVEECPIQLEAVLETTRPIGSRDPRLGVRALALEVRVLRVHVERELLMEDDADRIDPEKWHPLIMSFRQFYALGPRLPYSRLGAGPESRYSPARAQLKRAVSILGHRWFDAS